MTAVIEKRHNFIKQIIEDDLKNGTHQGKVVTRFPPEPNGYLHIGHAKSICLNFGLAQEYQGICHLRLDDTNPVKEDQEYIDAIKTDVAWLGFDWGKHLYHAADYFEQLYQYAVQLIQQGQAYVDNLTLEQMREFRGTLQQPGKESPHRNRSIEENLQLFADMRAGKYADGEYVLRAKIDMTSGNLNMRDPILYRIRHATHPHTGDAWCIYPMYDFAHALSDAIEGITHSICTLEFQDHRPLYDWFVNNVNTPAKPHQYEFARLNLSHTITSKRKLKQLVDEGHVTGWNDPRMPTLSGLRERGYPPEAIRQFCEAIGISKSDSLIDMTLLEEAVRNVLNDQAPRAMAVLKPLKITLINYDNDNQEILTAANHPQHPELGQRELPFCREIYIDRDDFKEEIDPQFYRLMPGREVRLRSSYVIKCEAVIHDENGVVSELHCSVDFNTLGKNPEGRKVKGVIQWLSARHCLPAEIRLYSRLFTIENPGAEEDYLQYLNPHSCEIVSGAFVEPNLALALPGAAFQFERVGYFKALPRATPESPLAFARIEGLMARP
jgi:glutaminyl-tRNA synthetase